MADNRSIGIFDSGLGGLTVAKEIIKQMPNENIVYFGDSGRVPYGTKSRETVRKYAKEDEQFLLKHNVKIIVAACGTVSSVASDTASELPVPFFEVISHAASAAVKATKNKKIGVIGTSVTIQSHSHKNAILKDMPDALIYEKACPLFVPLVEEGWYTEGDPSTVATVEKYLCNMKSEGVDTLILGCTHFPLLSRVISQYMGDGVTLINAGISVAGAVKNYLVNNGLENSKNNIANHEFFVSDKPASFGKTASILLGEEIKGEDVTLISLGK